MRNWPSALSKRSRRRLAIWTVVGGPLEPPATATIRLHPRWTEVVWRGADGAGIAEAVGTDVLAQVGVIYRWLAATQSWTSFRPGAPAPRRPGDPERVRHVRDWGKLLDRRRGGGGLDARGGRGLSAVALSPPQHRASQAESRGFESRLPRQVAARRRDRAAAGAPDAPPLADHLLSEQDDGAALRGHRRRRHGGRCARRVQPGRPSAGCRLSARRPPEGGLSPYQPPIRYQRYRMVSAAIGSGPDRALTSRRAGTWRTSGHASVDRPRAADPVPRRSAGRGARGHVPSATRRPAPRPSARGRRPADL